MQLRRLTAAAGALVLAAGLTACGGDEGDDASAGQLEGTGPITFVTGKDTSGFLAKQIEAWNADHPDEKAEVVELPEEADQQRQQMVQNARAKSKEYTVLNLDVIWTAEFAANGWIEQLPEDEFELDKLLPPTVETAKYFDKLYAVPVTSDGGLLYYRKDLLDAAGVQPPKTWAEMDAACKKIIPTPRPNLSCYAGQHEKYEGLTVNFSEAVQSAGGEVVGDDGKPNVDTEEARAGAEWLANSFKNQAIPEKGITFKEEEGRRAWQAGELVFHRNWPYVFDKSNATDGSSSVVGKFEVAPLPGLEGAGSSSLGGHNYAISKFAENKKSALEFMKFMNSEERQRANLEATSQAPTWAALYDDPALTGKFKYLPILKESILGAKPRPVAVRYQDVSTAIQEAAYSVETGEAPPDQALKDLQTKLEELTKE